MSTTFTPNIGLGNQGRGDNVGTWDTQLDTNFTLVDSVAGAIATIGLNNANVVLSAAQFQSKQITFNSTLTGSVAITFPTSFTKTYEIQNLCSGSSAFVITLQTTATGGQVICCPPGATFDCFNDGTNIKFKNFGPPVGGYWDYAGSSNPAWNTGCTVPPYLNCDGTTFSSGTYPALATVVGGTTLPDLRGRVRAYLNQGTARMTVGAGVDGNTLFAAGGAQTHTLTLAETPSFNYTPAGTISFPQAAAGSVVANLGGGIAPFSGASGNAYSGFAITANFIGTLAALGGSGASHTIMQPTAVGGLTLIRAA